METRTAFSEHPTELHIFSIQFIHKRCERIPNLFDFKILATENLANDWTDSLNINGVKTLQGSQALAWFCYLFIYVADQEWSLRKGQFRNIISEDSYIFS